MRSKGFFIARAVTIAAFLVGAAVNGEPPRPEFQSSLWIADKNGASKNLLPGNSLSFRLTAPADADAVALDERAGITWIFAGGDVRAYDFSGTLLRTVDLPAIPGFGSDRCEGVGASGVRGHLVVDQTDGFIWVGYDKHLYKISAQGQIIQDQTLPGEVVALAFDNSRRRVWVGQCATARAYDVNGTLQLDVSLLLSVENLKLRDLSFDQNADQLWAGLDKAVRRYDNTGSLLGSSVASGLNFIDTDGIGHAWIIENRTLSRIDINGSRPVSVLPFPGFIDPTLRALAVDTRVDLPGVWVAAADEIKRVNTAGLTTDTITRQQANLGNFPQVRALAVYTDRIVPDIAITAPTAGASVNTTQPPLALSFEDIGRGANENTLGLERNGNPLGANCSLGPNTATCAITTALPEGASALGAYVNDHAGNRGRAVPITVNVDTTPPVAVVAGLVSQTPVLGGQVTLAGAAASAEAGASVQVTNQRTGQVITVTVASNGSWSASISALANDTLQIRVRDAAGNLSSVLTRVASATPPNPVPTVLTGAGIPSFLDSVSFLFSGSGAVQYGMQSGSVDGESVAVVRGKVMKKDGTALSAVTVSIKDHPEFGYTLSRANGEFDLAVHGGQAMQLQYRAAGYLPAQRAMAMSKRDYAMAPDVMLVPLDTAMTIVPVGASAPATMARGTMVSDSSGLRRATLLFPAGTSAELVMPNGSRVSASSLAIRATEYTSGTNGPLSMPGSLPAQSGYTYALELSADEALAAGAKSVVFSQPVPLYVENFLHFPTGTPVPLGYYDEGKAAWTAAADGRVVNVLSVSGGRANLDVDGTGSTASATRYAELGISDMERSQLAQIYTAGVSLWRAPLPHFTPGDLNWPYLPPGDAVSPNPDSPASGGGDADQKPGCESGSIIECRNRALRETIPMVGTPFTLNYRSDRVPGRTSSNSLTVPLTRGSIPASLKQVTVEIALAGRMFKASYPPAANLVHQFTWDRKDAYGRIIDGEKVANITIGYVYDAFYAQPSVFLRSEVGTSSFGIAGQTAAIGDRTRQQYTLTATQQRRVGIYDARHQGFGGWTLSQHHAYDAAAGVLHLGSGERVQASAIVEGISTIAGGGTAPVSDGANAADVDLSSVQAIVNGPDGYYIATPGRIYKISSAGRISRYAGGGSGGFGSAARNASLTSSINGLAIGPDGNLYIAETTADRISRVNAAGIYELVAGNNGNGSSGDGGPAIAARFTYPERIAFAPDGTMYIADSYANRVRAITPDGIISTVAGTGAAGYGGDGGPATAAILNGPIGITIDSIGNLYIADSNNFRLRRVNAAGIITTIAGNGNFSLGEPGVPGPALAATIGLVTDVKIAPSGHVLFSRSYFWAPRIRQLDMRSGVVSNLVFTGDSTTNISATSEQIRDNGPARRAFTAQTFSFDVDGTGGLLIGDHFLSRVRAVTATLGEYNISEHRVAATDGSEVYIFSSSGRHLRTIHAVTGSTLYTFEYNGRGELTRITDGDTNVTTIERTPQGAPIAIVAPFGQRTNVVLDASGWLASVSNPDSEVYTTAHRSNGLLDSFAPPRGFATTFNYEADGSFKSELGPENGSWLATRTSIPGGYEVSMRSAESLTTRYRYETLVDGSERRTTTAPDGTAQISQDFRDGSVRETKADGTVIVTTQKGDPRFFLQAPYADQVTVTLPSGLTSSVETARVVNAATSPDSLAIVSSIETVTLNGRTFTSNYDGASRTYSYSSPEGRTSSLTVDAMGRPEKVTTPGLADVEYTYDLGRLNTVRQVDGSQQRLTRFTYGANGQVSKITDPLLREQLFQNYDLALRPRSLSLPGSRTIGLTWDDNGNLSSLTPPGRPPHGLGYNKVDQENLETPPSLGTGSWDTSALFDRDRRLDSFTRPDGVVIDYAYVPLTGKLDTISIPSGPGAGLYDYSWSSITGLLQTLTAPTGLSLAYTWDGSLLKSETINGGLIGSVMWSYDNNLRLSGLSVNGSTITYGFDEDGFLTEAGAMTLIRDTDNGSLRSTTVGGVSTRLSYTRFGELDVEIAVINNSNIYNADYDYDDLGRLIKKTELIQGSAIDWRYEYWQSGFLKTVKKNEAIVETYEYDGNGNRTTANGVMATFDDQDRLIAAGGISYGYSRSGHLSSRTTAGQTSTFGYDSFGNLVSVSLPGKSIGYLTDGRDRRVGKRVNGVVVQGFLYMDQIEPIAELDGAGNVVARFIYAENAHVPSYMMKNGIVYRIISDRLGSPRLVIDASSGAVMQRLDYDAWGNVVVDTNPGFQPFGFAGGIYDLDTKLIRYGARDYDPKIGRWSAKDPIRFEGGNSNLYSYVNNDPVNFVDPSGLICLGAGDIGAISGALGGAATGFIAGGGNPVSTVVGAIVGSTLGGISGVLKQELGDVTGSAVGASVQAVVDAAPQGPGRMALAGTIGFIAGGTVPAVNGGIGFDIAANGLFGAAAARAAFGSIKGAIAGGAVGSIVNEGASKFLNYINDCGCSPR